MPKRVMAREAAQVTVDDAAATAQPTGPDRRADGGESILVRVPPDTWRALKAVALDEDRTLQSVMVEAVDDYLRQKGKL